MGSISSARHRFTIERKSFEIVLEGVKDDLVRFTEFSKGGRRRSIYLSPAEAVWFVEAWDSLLDRSSSSDFRKLRSANRCVLLSIRSNFNGRFVKLTKVNGGEPRSIIFPEGVDAAGWENVFIKSRAIVDLLPGKYRRASKLRNRAPPPNAKDFPPLQATALNFKHAVTAPTRFSFSCPGCRRHFDGSLIEASPFHSVKDGGSSMAAPPEAAPPQPCAAAKDDSMVVEEKRAPARVRPRRHPTCSFSRDRRTGFGPAVVKGKALGRLVYRPKPVQPGLLSSVGFDPLADVLARGSFGPALLETPGFYEPVGFVQASEPETGSLVSDDPETGSLVSDDPSPSFPCNSTHASTEEGLALVPCEDFAMECTPLCVGSPEMEGEAAATASDRVLEKMKDFSSLFGIPLEGTDGERSVALFTKIERQKLEEALPIGRKGGATGSRTRDVSRELKRLEFAVNYDKVSHPR